MNKKIYTIGQFLTNRNRRWLKLDALVANLKNYSISSVIDLRYLATTQQPNYAPDNLKLFLNNNNITYLSRVEEVFMFYQYLATLKDPKEKTNAFRSHLYNPTINYITSLSEVYAPSALLFNSWEVFNLIPIDNSKNAFKSQPNFKGSFSKYIKVAKIPLDLSHLAPKKKGKGLAHYSNDQLFGKGEGHLLDIEYYLTSTTYDYSNSQDDELWKEVADHELKGMNEESGGAATWNID